jgi:hypothetical protein
MKNRKRDRLVLLVLAMCFAVSGALAQLRTVPQNAKLARVGEAQPLPFVQLNGNVVRLAPGGVIFDQNNRSILHGALPPGVRVAYTLELGGDVSRIYILTAQEQAQFDSKK